MSSNVAVNKLNQLLDEFHKAVRKHGTANPGKWKSETEKLYEMMGYSLPIQLRTKTSVRTIVRMGELIDPCHFFYGTDIEDDVLLEGMAILAIEKFLFCGNA